MDAISRENGNFYLDHLAEDRKWNIVGMPVIEGKKEVLESIKECEFVVVESIGKTTGNYFCDIYQIKYDKIQELTSYIVDTSSIESAGDIKREIFNK